MDKFVDLGASVFDSDFTLNPYPHLAKLHPRKELLGFRSEGMNFLFRFDQGRQVMLGGQCQRPDIDSDDLIERETRYAASYPNRAWFLARTYSRGTPNLQFKGAIGKFVAAIAATASLQPVEAVLSELGQRQGPVNYIQPIATLPLRLFLDSCLLPYVESDIDTLHHAGSAWLKSFENFGGEDLIRDADRGMGILREFMGQRMQDIAAESPLCPLIAAGRETGMDDEELIANIGGIFLAAMSNTVGMSSAFVLRTVLQHPELWQTLRALPALVENEHVITELLRRDNHVKALARQPLNAINIGGFTLRQGEVFYLFFPGINMDPAQWGDPERVDLKRQFGSDNNLVFGGAQYTCIGKRLAMAFLKITLKGFVSYLPANARIDDTELQLDGHWVAERIITEMPVQLAPT